MKQLRGLFDSAITLRWWVRKDRWFPASIVCDWKGHGNEVWYDGTWCERCGQELDY